MPRFSICVVAGAVALGLCGPALAHHSFAMFDPAKQMSLSGTVKAFQWTNPHIWIQVDVADAQGQVQEWGIEGTTPSVLSRLGWTRHALQPGDKVTVVIHPMKSGERGGSFVRLTFADGRVLSEAPDLGANSPQVQ